MALNWFELFKTPFANTAAKETAWSAADWAKGWHAIAGAHPSKEQANRTLYQNGRQTQWLFEHLEKAAERFNVTLTEGDTQTLADLLSGKFTRLMAVGSSGLVTPITTTGGSGVKVPLTRAWKNDRLMLNPATGVIMIPVSGWWQFSGHLTVRTPNASNTSRVVVKQFTFKNDEQVIPDAGCVMEAAQTTPLVLPFCSTFRAAAGDKIEMRAWASALGCEAWSQSMMTAQLVQWD